tara:strand:+ start:246 stop:491 length:246 start_codon:yes stop_codon:yes gene_type:complete
MSNKVVNVNLTGGLIGLLGDSPKNKLNKVVEEESKNGYRVVQIIPAASANLLLSLLRSILLVITLFFYTKSEGYYIIFEKK